MSLTPEAWQEKLERHFTEIAATRPVEQFPVFVLEHGLSSEELAEIATQLREQIRRGERLSKLWLLWVVHATEIGYLYDGHDYWPPFHRQMPHWAQTSTPATLVSWFKRFQRTYSGVEPSGPWANHFNRISWPITHAVLPKLLQLQFARALYDVSREVAQTRELDASSAGKILSKYSYQYSSRFQEFLQQEELAGRLMLAMLNRTPAGGAQNPIHPPTLKRITDDVAKVQEAGEYLKAAQRIVRDRFDGVHRTVVTPLRRDGDPVGARAHEISLDLRANLMLRRSAGNSWIAAIDIPSFAAVAKLSPDIAHFLRRTRCTIAGVGKTLFPPGFLLFGSQTRALKSWPASNEWVVTFEAKNPELENLMRRDCRFSTDSMWLFRVGSDGLARELEGRSVRSGQRYVIVSRQPIDISKLPAKTAAISCDGISAIELEMPDFVTPEMIQALATLGIQVSRRIRLWPAGLSIRNWDGEGRGVWISSEAPCFGLRHDHAVEEYILRLNDEPALHLDGARAKQTVFVRLPYLAPGRHVIHVQAKRVGLLSVQEKRDLEGEVELTVRDPDHWKPGVPGHTGLLISTDPNDPSLDDFWEGNVDISVQGPLGHSVTCHITLTGENGDVVLDEDIGIFPLPIKPSQWRTRLHKFTNEDSRTWKYLDASAGTFTIRGDELGQYILRLEHESKPIRWVGRLTANEAKVRLIDETGIDDPVETQFYSFEQPLVGQMVDLAEAHQGVLAGNPGGLYFARQGRHRDSFVISTTRHAHGFSELAIEPTVFGFGSEPRDLLQLLALIELWAEARLAGTLADSRREHIVQSLTNRLYSTFAGDHWIKVEAAYRGDPISNTERIKAALGNHRSFAAAILHNAEGDQRQADNGVWFCDAARRYAICDEDALTKFAVRVATSPIGVVSEFGNDAEGLLKKLKTMGILFRGARLSAILAQREPDQGVAVHSWQ